MLGLVAGLAVVYKEGEEDLGGAELAGFRPEEDLEGGFALV